MVVPPLTGGPGEGEKEATCVGSCSIDNDTDSPAKAAVGRKCRGLGYTCILTLEMIMTL